LPKRRRYFSTRCRIAVSDSAPFFTANAVQARLTGRMEKCTKNPTPAIALWGLFRRNRIGCPLSRRLNPCSPPGRQKLTSSRSGRPERNRYHS
jgi:hypothetical protein